MLISRGWSLGWGQEGWYRAVQLVCVITACNQRAGCATAEAYWVFYKRDAYTYLTKISDIYLCNNYKCNQRQRIQIYLRKKSETWAPSIARISNTPIAEVWVKNKFKVKICCQPIIILTMICVTWAQPVKHPLILEHSHVQLHQAPWAPLADVEFLFILNLRRMQQKGVSVQHQTVYAAANLLYFSLTVQSQSLKNDLKTVCCNKADMTTTITLAHFNNPLKDKWRTNNLSCCKLSNSSKCINVIKVLVCFTLKIIVWS